MLRVMAKLVVCGDCGRTMSLCARGLCSRCYLGRLIKCGDCGEVKPHAAHGLCNACNKRAYRTRDVVCTECGRTMPKATNELCARCYYRKRGRYVKLVKCGNCGETKQHAAHGLCYKCYGKLHRPKISAESRTARVERLRQQHENRAQHERELHNRRCGTCSRLLRVVRGRLEPRASFCDGFCRDHNPERNSKRNAKRMHEATEAELQRREIEASFHTERAVA